MLLPTLAVASEHLLGALGVGLLLALALCHLLVPAARPLLVEACRGVQRGRFWTRFLGLSLMLAVPLGVLLAFVHGDELLVIGIPWEQEGGVRDQAVLLRMGLQFGAAVFLLLLLAILATLPRERDAE